MVCVDKKSPEFLRLARRMNLDANILEQIIHKYYRESGQEELFPTDMYVNAQLGRTQYEEAMPTVRQFWENAYSQPKTFSSEGEYRQAWVQAINYFPKEAIVNYKDANGNFILAVRRPVEKLELAEGKVSPVFDAEGNMIPAITEQERRDFELIARQQVGNSENIATFAPAMTQELNQKVFDNLKRKLQLDRYESRSEGHARTAGEQGQAADGDLLGESQARIQRRDSSLREAKEQRVLTQRQQEQRNSEDKAALEKLAKEQGRWRDNVDQRLEEDLGEMIGHGAESYVYRIPDGPVLKARTIDPDIEGSYKSLEEALASIEIHNRLFPETAMKIVGYGESDGEFNVILEQPYIEGRFATKEEIDQFIKERFNAEKDPSVVGDTSYKTDAYLMQDLKEKNVIVREGKLYVIDGDFYLTDEHKQFLRLQEAMEKQKKESAPRPARKERQVIGPQPFTFNDGTVVTVPFKPNEQQAEALNAMNDFLNSDETTMTLSGYAGTGKTSLMEIIAQKAKRQHKPIMFSATTNKAAAVLKARVSKAGFDAQTLNKVFGINVEVDSSKAYNARNLVTALRDADIMPGTTVVIDEASMINEENYRILNRIARENGLKIIYVGDKAQLAPVNETQVSKVFRNTEGRVVELTQVERTDDNAILKEATNIRNGLPLSGESSFNERGEGVGYLTPKSRDEIGKVIRHYIQGLKDNPNFFRILAYTNKKVTEYNDFVRTLLGYTDPIPHVGEPLTGYNNWGYDWRTKSYRFINSESYKVTRVGKPAQSKISVNGQEFTMTYVPVTMENSLGESDTFNYMDIKGNQENRQAALQLANQKKTLWEQYRKAVGREAKSNILAQINSIDQFLFVNDNIEDPTTHNLLQPKTVDFGYALTIHKSQGSTFTHVLIDDIDVAKASNTQNNAANAMAMVDLGDAGQIADATMEVRGTEEVDLGDLSSVPVESTYSPSPDVANVRQQLEYVGVSRATNTVTVISNNVKKEGSPLNQNLSPDKADNSYQVKGSSLNEERAKTLTKEVVNHLVNMGLPVKYKADMEKYFQDHPNALNSIQKALAGSQLSFARGVKVPKGVDKYLLSSAIMTQANTFENIREQLNENIGSVAKRVIFFGNDAYLWSTENGYEFFIEQALPINERNYNTLNEWIDTYGTDDKTLGIIRSIKALRGTKERMHSYLESLRGRGADVYSSANSRINGLKWLGAANTTGVDGNALANTEGEEQFFIGKKARTKFEQQLMKARPDLAIPSYNINGISFEKDIFSDEFINSQITKEEADALKKQGLIKNGSFGLYALTEEGIAASAVSYPQIDSVLDFLHSLEDNKENTAYIKTAIKWIANNSLALPQDNVKARQAFDLARKRNIDLQKYNTLGELIASDEMKPKEKKKVPFNPNKAKTFSNKRTVTTEGGRTFIVYDVENTEEGQREVCKALAANYAMSPWCLSTFTATGEPTESAKKWWNTYNSLPRKIAYENGKPVAFNSSDNKTSTYYYKGKEINFLDEQVVSELEELGYVERNPYFGTFVTKKGEQALERKEREAWWDFEDAKPQRTLNDSILNEKMFEEKKKEMASMVPEGFLDEDTTHEEPVYDTSDFGFGVPGRGLETPNWTEEELPFFITPEGEVFGFVDKDGNIYLDETAISPEHPIHEYTHLWDRVVAQKNPRLWKRGVELMKQTSVWKEIEESEQYGKKWKAMQNMPAGKLENLIASEVHARLTGEGGAQLLDKLAQEKGANGIIGKLKQWILDFWKDLKATFSDWSDDDLQKLTLKDFNHMTVRDFADGVNFTNLDNVTKEEAEQNQMLPVEEETVEQPQPVSLPSYEYFMDRYEDTTVDAAWKIPLLQQLDSQLTTELSPEENNDILDRMTRILEAKSQEDLLDLQTEEPKEKKTVEQNLTEFEKMTQQINNLLDSNIISASEIRHVAELVVNSISDTITILQKEDGAAKKFFPNIETKIDFKTASRKDIVEAIGINNLIHRAKQQFDPEQNDYEDFDTIDQADLIIDNWDAIMTLAADTFAMTEGFGIMRNYDNGGFNTTQAPTIDYDNFNDYSNDSDAMAESEKDEQEHWQVEQRTIDVLNSMSQLVRLALHDCYQMDKDGNKVMSKWGIAERVNPRQAVNSILRWTQGALSLEDMIQRMQNKATQNPWLNQLVERLSDKSGQEADFQSQFFGVFSKHFQPYSVVLLEDGKYHSIPVNSHPALSEAMQTITTQFKIGEHPLFTDKGINVKLLGTERTTFPEADFNLHKALSNLQTIQDRLNHGEQFSDKIAKDATAEIMGVCRILGYPVTEEMLSEAINEENLKYMTDKLYHMVKSLDAALEAQKREPNKPYNPFAFGTDNSIGGTLRNFLTPITDTLEDTAVSAFYDSGKMYQSYVTPSFMTKLMNKFRLEGQEFEDFIMQEYGNSEWFKSGKNQWDVSRGWRNVWLQLLATDENARKVFDHKVELNFNKHNYMRNMSDAEYTLSLITEYFAETAQKGQSMVPAWFRIPIMSNKPSSEFIKFYSYRGANYKDEIIFGLHQMFNQELSRIQTVNMRNHSKGDSEFIANFDTNGRKFNFLPFLNQFLDKANHSELATLLQKKVEGLTALTAEEEARLSTLVDQAIRQDMDTRVNKILNEWENSGILEAAQNIDGIGTEEAQIRANLENFLWNDNFASKNILQLTVTDIAFYKDAEDLQKRLAQIHAPGIRGNVAATDYEGNRVSDGKYRTILIQGLQKFKTDLIANLTEVFDRKIAAAPDSQKAQWRALKEDLVGENGRYTKIDVTDGQGYSSPSSYRKKAFIFGRWSRQAEDIYQKLLKGDYNYSDLKVAFQPLKPFVYTHLQKDMGVDNAPIHSMPVPFQAKNSEYLLIMADALLQGEKTSKPNLLRAIYRVMEDSERLAPTKGIDTVQFDSAIKSGLQAPIDLNPFVDMVGGEEAAFEYMKSLIYKLDDQGNPSVEYNTDTYVHEGEYEDYCLQQEVPEHFKDHSQAHGSQIRMIIPSDLDFYKNPNGDRTAEDNQVYYEWTEPDGTKKKLKADEFRKEYEKTIADNIRESIDLLSQELHINSNDKKERNIALSKILQREILSSPRYGIDLIQACSIDKETGEFRIPKGDPIQAKRIEQLINSIIKNRVNKQKIAGGPIVQVTNFGTSRQLHIRFNDKNGGLLMTREEYEQNPQKKEMSQTDKFNARYGKKIASGNMTYEEYVKQNQAGIAYFEVFVPIWSNELFEKFANPDGSINVEAIEATDPELLKMISYRIPTEDKYSCAPMKVVGFMPREAGDAIMFPYELTEIDDSDFDVDKRYTMRKDIPIKRKAKHIIRKELFDIVSDSYQKQYNKELPANIASEIEMFLDSPDTMKNKNSFNQWMYSQYQRIAYTTEAPTSGRTYRDNKIVDMTWAVLTNEMTADKILNPGGFDVFKKNGYMVAAYKNPANNYSWEQLQQMSIDELNKLSYTDKDLTWLDTQIQFYKQNAAAASLIGVFAVNKVAHATLESNNYYVAVDEICDPRPFIIADTEFGGRMKVDPTYDREGNLIGKTIGAGVSASADAAKTPVLNLMNINMTTAGIFNTLLRLGMAPNDASLFMSQDVIERVLNEFNRENLTNYKPLSTIIEEHLSELREKHNISDDSNINSEALSREEMVDGLLPVNHMNQDSHEVIDYKVLLAFQKVRSLVDAMRKPTFATRFNSVSSAVGPLIIDNLIIEHKMEQFTDAATEDGTHFYDSEGTPVDIDDIFYDHPILKEFSRTVDIAKSMFYDMPAGSRGFRNLLATLPEGLIDKVYNDKKLLDNLSNFYQSYLLIASRMVNPANLKNYIDGFPKYFNEHKFKEKYPDNALIQAIRMNVAKRTGRPFLSINITGIDEAQKEVYRSAWIDLHKDNPELSKRLFEYCFFRAGIGFSPKTFMSLVPAYVKERLSTDLDNGTQATYVDTYRMFPTVNPEVVIDQWVRNNWDNNKLVPKKGSEDTHYTVDLKRGTLVARDPKDMADLKSDKYIKTSHNGQTYLWKQLIADKTAVNYVMVKPLGNNGEYMEMSLADITKPLNETKETIEDMQESELQATSPAEADATQESNADIVTDGEKAKQTAELAELLMKQNPKFNKTQALNQIERMKKKPDMYAGFLVNVFKQKGLNLTKEEAIKEFKKMC